MDMDLCWSPWSVINDRTKIINLCGLLKTRITSCQFSRLYEGYIIRVPSSQAPCILELSLITPIVYLSDIMHIILSCIIDFEIFSIYVAANIYKL